MFSKLNNSGGRGTVFRRVRISSPFNSEENSKTKAKKEAVEINVEGGKTYYVQLVFQPGLLVNNVYPHEVTESSAKKVLEQCVRGGYVFVV